MEMETHTVHDVPNTEPGICLVYRETVEAHIDKLVGKNHRSCISPEYCASLWNSEKVKWSLKFDPSRWSPICSPLLSYVVFCI